MPLTAWRRGFGIESTADKALDVRVGDFSLLRYLQEEQRADERTRTADLLTTSDLKGFLCSDMPCVAPIAFPSVSKWCGDLNYPVARSQHGSAVQVPDKCAPKIGDPSARSDLPTVVQKYNPVLRL